MSRITAADVAAGIASDRFDTEIVVTPDDGENTGVVLTAKPRPWALDSPNQAAWDVRRVGSRQRFHVVLTVTEVES